MSENAHPRQGRALVADANLHMLRGVHTLLESLFDSTVMVSDERSLLTTAENCRQDICVVDLLFPVTAEVNVILLIRKRFPVAAGGRVELVRRAVGCARGDCTGSHGVRAETHGFGGPRVGRRGGPAARDLCLPFRGARRSAGRTDVATKPKYVVRWMNPDKAMRQANRKGGCNARCPPQCQEESFASNQPRPVTEATT